MKRATPTPSLFGPPDAYGGFVEAPPPAVRHDAPATSIAAAESVKLSAASQRRQVLEYLSSQPDGMTDEEIQNACWLNPSSQRPRRGELVEMGLVVDSGRVRKTHSGRDAIVWIVTDAGKQQLTHGD